MLRMWPNDAIDPERSILVWVGLVPAAGEIYGFKKGLERLGTFEHGVDHAHPNIGKKVHAKLAMPS